MADHSRGGRVRNRWLDAVRFAAVYAVVLQHSLRVPADTGEAAALALLGSSMWAVPLLFATSGYLSVLGGRTVDIRKRLRRLLVPYAAWSAVLFPYTAWQVVTTGYTPSPDDWLGVIFAGQAFYTLWFLAMLVYATLVGWALRSYRSRIAGSLVALLAYALVAIARSGQPVLATDTWGGFLTIAPACIALYLAGAVLGTAPPRAGGWKVAVACGVSVTASAVLYRIWGPTLSQDQQFAIVCVGSVAALAALSASDLVRADSRALSAAARAGTFTLGIYALHPVVLIGVWLVTGTRDSTSLLWGVAMSVIGTSLALAASRGVSRVRWLRQIVQ